MISEKSYTPLIIYLTITVLASLGIYIYKFVVNKNDNKAWTTFASTLCVMSLTTGLLYWLINKNSSDLQIWGATVPCLIVTIMLPYADKILAAMYKPKDT